jgi:hypothetical protein
MLVRNILDSALTIYGCRDSLVDRASWSLLNHFFLIFAVGGGVGVACLTRACGWGGHLLAARPLGLLGGGSVVQGWGPPLGCPCAERPTVWQACPRREEMTTPAPTHLRWFPPPPSPKWCQDPGRRPGRRTHHRLGCELENSPRGGRRVPSRCRGGSRGRSRRWRCCRLPVLLCTR